VEGEGGCPGECSDQHQPEAAGTERPMNLHGQKVIEDADRVVERLRSEERELLDQAAAKRKAYEQILDAQQEFVLGDKKRSEMSYPEKSEVIARRGLDALLAIDP
jgi:hypothetical protein